MNPTMKLRWVKRVKSLDPELMGIPCVIHLVLQQWWAVFRHGQETPTGEWRDIPIETDARN